jgi:hypothetical protein
LAKLDLQLYLKRLKILKKTLHTHTPPIIKKDKSVLIINVMRNIFDRNISAFFQNIYNEKHKLWHYKGNTKNLNELMIHYTDANKIHNSMHISTWYNRFNVLFNINVFDTKFDHNKKYSLYTSNNISILLLRFEDINHWETIFHDIFGTQIKLINRNLTNKKLIFELYNQFKNKYNYDIDDINLISNIDFMKHFYTDDEISTFIAKYNKTN